MEKQNKKSSFSNVGSAATLESPEASSATQIKNLDENKNESNSSSHIRMAPVPESSETTFKTQMKTSAENRIKESSIPNGGIAVNLDSSETSSTDTTLTRNSPSDTETKRSNEKVKASRQNFAKFKLRSAAFFHSQRDPSYIQLLGLVNRLSHRLAYLEDKLNCRDEMPTMVLFPEEIGDSSTDEFELPIYASIPHLEENVRAAQTTAQSVNMELPFSNGSAGSVESLNSGGSSDSGGDFFQIRVRIPEIDMQNHLCFRRDKSIWFAKLQLLKSLSKPLTDSLNFGFYLPPAHGKAGKFLEEERLFSAYPTDPSSMPFLEFKYKRRVYKQMKLDIKEVKKYHNKANIKAFFESVRSKNLDKITKMTGKCMDPNIHEESTGETPLTIAASLKDAGAVVQALVGGGAHLDYRARDGQTALHKAVKTGNQSTIELLLSLGASPDYKDSRGLTPLYYNVHSGGEPMIAELLLKDRAAVNISDEQGWREIHHACRYGRAQHLQLLIYYGADIKCQNEAGNTPLHICAAYNQETAARLVLFRGGNRAMKNKSSQTPFQVAIVSNNFTLGEIIRNYSDDDVVIQQEVPTYNKRRRCSSLAAGPPGALSRATSEPFLPGSSLSLNPAGNRMSVASSSSFTNEDSIPEESSAPKRSGSVGSMGRTAAVARMVHRKIKDAKSSKQYICVKPYVAQEYGELNLLKGDYVKVYGIGEFNFWEGEVGNSRGWFPSECIREVTGRERAQTMRERRANYPESLVPTKQHEVEPRVVFVERKKKGFGFVLRGAKSPQGASSAFKPTKEFPALQYLEHVDKGSPAEKAGLKKGDFVLEINSQDVTSAPHQYVVSLVINSPDTIVMKVITVPNSKALVWLNEAKKNSLRKKPPTSQPSLTKLKTEKVQQEIQAINVLDEAIAKAESPTEDQTDSPYASIRKRPISQKISPEHLSSVFQRQSSAPTTSTPEEHRTGLKKPVIPLAPSAFRFNTVARMSSSKTNFPTAASAVSPIDRMTMETQTQFDDDSYEKQKRRNSAGSDSAVSSLRSSPASSYSYTTSVSNDSGVYTRADRTMSDVTSLTDPHVTHLPPAPDYPAPSIPPAPNYPAPQHPNNLGARSQSLHNLKTESFLSERQMSTGHSRPSKPPPPVPRRDSSISDGNLSRSNSSEPSRPSSLDISHSLQIEASPEPDTEPNSAFASAIAAAAAKREKLRKSTSCDSLDAKTPLELALAARDQSLSGGNQNRNQNAETTASQGSPQLDLNEAIAKRKARLDANKDPSENIESKIRKYKQADSGKGSSANQAFLSAIAKRRSTIEKQMSEDSDSQSTSSDGSTKIEAEKKDAAEPKGASSIKEADIAQAAAVMQTRLASKPPVKEPVNSFAGHKNVIKIVPRGEGSKPGSPASQSPREKADPSSPASPDTDAQSLKHPKLDMYKHPLSPVKENDGDFGNIPGSLQNSHQANGHVDTDSSPQLPPLGDHRRERSFDTASVVSSMSSMSTMSSYSTMSTEPSSDIFEQDEDDARTNTMKSTSSSSSNATLTSKNSKPSPKVLPKPKRKSQHFDDDTSPRSSETLDNEGSMVIHSAPSSEVDNKQSMLSAWTEQGSNSNQNDGAEGWKSKPFLEWTPQDVGLWLTSLNLSEHRGSFEENEIAGEHLSGLTKDDLQELGVGRMGHRLTITKAVQRLTS